MVGYSRGHVLLPQSFGLGRDATVARLVSQRGRRIASPGCVIVGAISDTGNVLGADRQGLTAESLWELYVTLTRAEDGFKALKSDFGLRPNYHQLEPRVDAHVFITVLAYQLLRSLLYRLEQKNDTRGWETIKRVVQTHAYTTIELPATDGKLCHLRKAGRPEEQQTAIYEMLGIDWRNLPAPQSEVIVKK